MPKTDPPPEKAPAVRQKRMGREEREALIVREAVIYFAEHGFEGNTRDLAKRIGITQPLLYRYFPSKDSLIERVYQEVYVSRWDPAWEALLRDRSRPLVERLVEYYQAYAAAVYDYVWVRIFMYSGLKGVDINDRYLSIVRTKVLEPICVELRFEAGLPGPDETPLKDAELELVWGLHGTFFYRATRHFVYGQPMTDDPNAAIEHDVRTFARGAAATLRSILS